MLSSLLGYASTIEKEYKKLIEKYDVSDSAKIVPKNNPTKFWQAALFYNEAYIKYLSEIKKNRGAEKEALKRTSDLPRFYPQYDESIIEGLQGFCDTILIDMGIDKLPIKCSLHIIYSDEVFAFTALTEESFAICLTMPLLQRKGMTREGVMGIVAHQFSHGALEHIIRGHYAEAKKRRKDELAAGIVKGLNAFSSSLNSNNTNHFLENYQVDMILKDEVKASTLKFMNEFTEEQEYEADLMAFRFIEYLLGSGEEYINVLRILGSVYNHITNESNDFVTTSSRINFLKFVKENPNLGNKVNARLRQSRVKKIYAPAQF